MPCTPRFTAVLASLGAMIPLISTGTLIPLRILSMTSQLMAECVTAARLAGLAPAFVLGNGKLVVMQIALQPDLTAAAILALASETSPCGKTWYQRTVDD